MLFQLELCLRVVGAAACGILLGYERSKHYKAAGPRVYSLIASASALLMIVSKYGFGDLETASGFLYGTNGADPSRIASSVIGGIAFVCIAIVYRKGSTLRGLTTASGILMGAAVGLCIGAGEYILGVFATLFTYLIQFIMHKKYIDNDSMATRDVSIRMKDDEELRKAVIAEIESLGTTTAGRSLTKNGDGTMTYTFILKLNKRVGFGDLLEVSQSHPNEIFDISIN